MGIWGGECSGPFSYNSSAQKIQKTIQSGINLIKQTSIIRCTHTHRKSYSSSQRGVSNVCCGGPILITSVVNVSFSLVTWLKSKQEGRDKSVAKYSVLLGGTRTLRTLSRGLEVAGWLLGWLSRWDLS